MAELISGHWYREKNHPRDCILVMCKYQTDDWFQWNTGWRHNVGWMPINKDKLIKKCGEDLGSFTSAIDRLSAKILEGE